MSATAIVKAEPSGLARRDAERYAVLCVRSDGRFRLFQAYPSQREAEAVATRLRAVGCHAVVEAE